MRDKKRNGYSLMRIQRWTSPRISAKPPVSRFLSPDSFLFPSRRAASWHSLPGTPHAARRSPRSAFTFIELLMVLAILGALITVTYAFYFFAFRSTIRGYDTIEMHKKMRLVLEKMEADLRNARDIDKIAPDELEMRLFRDPRELENHVILSDDSLVKRVAWIVRKDGGNNECVLIRKEERSEQEIMRYPTIGLEMFKAWTFDMSGQFIVFDPVINDSWQRERISLVEIHLQLKERNTSLDMTGSVSPRYLYGRKRQPDWNFNSNVTADQL